MKPLRCFNCQAFGHHVKKCNAVRYCGKCNSQDHPEKDCQVSEEEYKCHNCLGNHSAWAKDCPKYIVEQKVCDYKVTHDVSFFEARKVVIPKNNKTWAAAVAVKPSISIETQTYLTLDPLREYEYEHIIRQDHLSNEFLFKDKSGDNTREGENSKAYEQNSKPVPPVSSKNDQTELINSDDEDNFPQNQKCHPRTPMRNYTPRHDYSDRTFNFDHSRPNTSRSLPYTETDRRHYNHSDRNFKPYSSNMSRSPPYTEQDKSNSKNRKVMTESENEEEECIQRMVRSQTRDSPQDREFVESMIRKQMRESSHLYKK